MTSQAELLATCLETSLEPPKREAKEWKEPKEFKELHGAMGGAEQRLFCTCTWLAIFGEKLHVLSGTGLQLKATGKIGDSVSPLLVKGQCYM